MKSERAPITMRYRSEGEEEGLKIRAEADQEKTRILSEAFKVGETHRGEGEAEAARIYAEALGAAPEFYGFLRTLEASRRFVGEGTTLVLPASSELFGLLYDSHHYERATASEDRVLEAPQDDDPQADGDEPAGGFFNQEGG
jgi:membrane protease subunit HflC